MQLLSAEEFAIESKRYYEGDRRARPPAHLLRILRHEDLPQVLGPDNWAVVRYPLSAVPQIPPAEPLRPLHHRERRAGTELVSAPL